MSSDAEALLLPGELDRLEIAPTLPQVKLLDSHLPLSLNPFYDGADQQHVAASTSSAIQQNNCARRPSHCRNCRQRRCSESVLDDYKAAAAVANNNEPHKFAALGVTASRSTPGVQRAVLKKSAALSTGARGKLLIRPPVLRALQTCLLHQPQSSVRRKLLPDAEDAAQKTALQGVSAAETPQAASSGISNFRDLISECQTLLETEVGFKNKNFMTLRERQIGASLKGGGGGGGTLLPSHSSNSSITIFPSPCTDNALREASGGSPTPPEHACAATRAATNTSCSQQASATPTPAPAAADDVTIDELACYFDTLVHIPKKMSSMAEMMYI